MNRPAADRLIREGDVVYSDRAAADLLGADLAAISDPAGAGFKEVKRNASRTVYRGMIRDRAVYVKHYHSRSLAHRLGRLFGQIDAHHEMTFSQHLAAAGVSTPHVLAARWHGGEHWLVTAAVEPATPADAWHDRLDADNPVDQRSLRRSTYALAELIGRMHAAGVLHGDLHCGNVLVQTVGDEIRLVLTDLHRARRCRRPSRRALAANLAQLFHDRLEFTKRTDRLRFLQHYLRVSKARGSLRGWQLMVEHLGERHRRHQHAQRDRRAEGKNQYFTPLHLPGGWRGHAVLASKRRLAGSQAANQVFTAEQWIGALSSPDPAALLSEDTGDVAKKSKSSLVVRRTLRLGDTNVDVYVKRHRRKYRWKLLADCFRPSRALRAFRLGHALLTRRIPTALPLAALERRVGPFLTDSILITEMVPWARLDEFLPTYLGAGPAADHGWSAAQQHRLAQEVLWQMGRVLQQLHDHNFAHRDLKASNMFVRWEPGRSPDIVLVDLDGLRSVRHLTTRQQFQGLMRLNVSLLKCPAVNHAGQLRMLLGYLRRPGSGRINFKPYWRVLEQWSARKLGRQIRSRQNAQSQRRQAARRATT